MTPEQQEALRSLPSVSELLESDEVQHWLQEVSRSVVLRAVQDAVDQVRQEILDGDADQAPDADTILAYADELLAARMEPLLKRVINASGVVLHTGLGRAPLCDAAIEAIADAVGGYCTLEYDLESGKRGQRVKRIGELLAQLTGAEAATVCNNNAAATLLILNTFARDREVIVSRGQLVEIGGSYRLPAIMTASGADMHEVGTTNRTHLSDYQQAINDRTAILLRVHCSNFRVVGFSKSTPLEDIVELAHRFGLIAVDDLGSGAMFDLARLGLPAEPSVPESLEAGVDLVCFSGDKLLGGPQAGIILGRKDLIARIQANPLARCCRVGKLTLLALEATLRFCDDIDRARAAIPTLAMLSASMEELADHAGDLCDLLQKAVPNESFYVCSDVTYAGGGSMPARTLQTVVVQWRPAGLGIDVVMRALRHADVPVIARVREDGICFDLRTIHVDEFEDLAASVAAAGGAADG